MHRRRDSPQQHATRHPSNHAISSPERSPRRLQRDEESKEQHDCRIEIAFMEPDIRREMRRLGIANL
jgi:hypothetical protein